MDFGSVRPKLRTLQPLHGLRTTKIVQFDSLVLLHRPKKPIILCRSSASVDDCEYIFRGPCQGPFMALDFICFFVKGNCVLFSLIMTIRDTIVIVMINELMIRINLICWCKKVFTAGHKGNLKINLISVNCFLDTGFWNRELCNYLFVHIISTSADKKCYFILLHCLIISYSNETCKQPDIWLH